MIIRILGEGQLEVPDGELGPLNELDTTLSNAVDAGDETEFRSALAALLGRVRQAGTPVPDDSLEPSEHVLPGPDTDLEAVRQLLGDEGLIPG